MKNILSTLENKLLTEDFLKRKEEIQEFNTNKTLELLRAHEIDSELKASGLLLTQKEASLRAAGTFLKLLNAKLIDEWGHIVPGAQEVIKG